MKIGVKLGKIYVILSLLMIVVIMIVPQTLAKQEYATALQTVYGTNSCTNCHIDQSLGGKSLNDYGINFKSQPNYKNDPATAIRAIGSPSGVITTTAPIVTTQATQTVIATATTTVMMTDKVAEAPVVTTTPVITDTTGKTNKEASEKEEENDEKEETRASPGFDIAATIGMISAIYILGRYKIGRR